MVVPENRAEDAHTSSTRVSVGMIMAIRDVHAAASYLDTRAGGMVPYDLADPERAADRGATSTPECSTHAESRSGALFAAGERGQAVDLRYPPDDNNLSKALCFGQTAVKA